MRKRKVNRRVVEDKVKDEVFIRNGANPEKHELRSAHILAEYFGNIEFIAPKRIKGNKNAFKN